MSTELALSTQMNFDDLAAITGQIVSGSRDNLARLSINRDFDTPEGKTIPPGTYKVSGYNDKDIFAKTVKFRPYINAYQYIVYDASTNTFPNKSVLFKNFNEEAVDEKGGVKCGKISGKQKDKLTEAQVTEQKKIKCNRFLFGTVSMTGTDSDGNETTITGFPVLWKSGGSAFLPVNDALAPLTKAQRPFFQAELDMSTPKREKNGSNIYYLPVMTADMKTVKPIDENDIILLKQFQAYIDHENTQVIEKYKKAKSKQEVDDIAGEIIDSGFIQINDDEMYNDPIDL